MCIPCVLNKILFLFFLFSEKVMAEQLVFDIGATLISIFGGMVFGLGVARLRNSLRPRYIVHPVMLDAMKFHPGEESDEESDESSDESSKDAPKANAVTAPPIARSAD
jgi:hypothetical protein